MISPRPGSGSAWRVSTVAIAFMLALACGFGCTPTREHVRSDDVAALIAKVEREPDAGKRAEYADQLRRALEIDRTGDDRATGTSGFPVLRLEQVDLGLDTGRIEAAPKDANGDVGQGRVIITLIPKDQFGHTIKIPCRVSVALHRAGFGGLRSKALFRWPDVSPAEVNKTWVDQTFSGYRLKLPWPASVERTQPVVLVVTATTEDGATKSARRTYAEGIHP